MLEKLALRFCVADSRLKTSVCGMDFYNPVGLAAGFDKNATMTKGLLSLGFGQYKAAAQLRQSPKMAIANRAFFDS